MKYPDEHEWVFEEGNLIIWYRDWNEIMFQEFLPDGTAGRFILKEIMKEGIYQEKYFPQSTIKGRK